MPKDLTEGLNQAIECSVEPDEPFNPVNEIQIEILEPRKQNLHQFDWDTLDDDQKTYVFLEAEKQGIFDAEQYWCERDYKEQLKILKEYCGSNSNNDQISNSNNSGDHERFEIHQKCLKEHNNSNTHSNIQIQQSKEGIGWDTLNFNQQRYIFEATYQECRMLRLTPSVEQYWSMLDISIQKRMLSDYEREVDNQAIINEILSRLGEVHYLGSSNRNEIYTEIKDKMKSLDKNQAMASEKLEQLFPFLFEKYVGRLKSFSSSSPYVATIKAIFSDYLKVDLPTIVMPFSNPDPQKYCSSEIIRDALAAYEHKESNEFKFINC